MRRDGESSFERLTLSISPLMVLLAARWEYASEQWLVA
jgi:hypothetical protein